MYSSGENAKEEHSQQWDANIAALEDLLATKLSEFLGSSYSYTLHQIPSSMKAHLYKGPPSGTRHQLRVAKVAQKMAQLLAPVWKARLGEQYLFKWNVVANDQVRMLHHANLV